MILPLKEELKHSSLLAVWDIDTNFESCLFHHNYLSFKNSRIKKYRMCSEAKLDLMNKNFL